MQYLFNIVLKHNGSFPFKYVEILLQNGADFSTYNDNVQYDILINVLDTLLGHIIHQKSHVTPTNYYAFGIINNIYILCKKYNKHFIENTINRKKIINIVNNILNISSLNIDKFKNLFNILINYSNISINPIIDLNVIMPKNVNFYLFLKSAMVRNHYFSKSNIFDKYLFKKISVYM
jgi:hypothetical protein